MTSSKTADYDALVATTSIADITENEDNQNILRLLRDDDARLSRLRLRSDDIAVEYWTCDDYHPGSSAELGWLGHFAKTSTHLDNFTLFGGDIFSRCSEQSVVRFFQDIGKCIHIREMYFICTDLTAIIDKLGGVMKKSDNITHWLAEECDLGVDELNFLFNVFRDMENLEELSIDNGDRILDDDAMAGGIKSLAACTSMRGLNLSLPGLSTNSWAALSAIFPRMISLQELSIENADHSLNDDIMAGYIPSLKDCTAMLRLNLSRLGSSTKSCAALSVIFPRMISLRQLRLTKNSIDDDCAKVLAQGLSKCKHLQSLSLSGNRIGDGGLDVLIQGLPASVTHVRMESNAITLARPIQLLRFETLGLSGNALSPGGPRVIAASLANPECRLETLVLYHINIGDEGLASLAESLRSNQRLTRMLLVWSNITETGWNAFSSVLCDATSINATHGSNHTLQWLGTTRANIPQAVKTMLELNSDQDKSHVAATKILRSHLHFDMKPLFDRKLDLLPYVVAWLEHFAAFRLDLKLSSIFEFVRAVPMDVVVGVAGEKKGKKRVHNSI